MKKMMIAAIAALSVISAAACGNQTAETSAIEPDQQKQSTNSAPQNDATSAEQTEGTGEPAQETTKGDTAQSDDETSQAVGVQASTKQQYYINDIFDVKPISEEFNEKVVLLTFDDGPKEEGMVSELLDVLDQHHAKAIFFVNGYRVKQNPELLKLISSRGHEIGNHSWDHIILSKESKAVIEQQIEDVQMLVEELIGEAPRFFRAPNGARNDDVTRKVEEELMIYMNWSNGSLDWDPASQTPEAVIDNVMEQLRPGSNILMHELPWTVEALDALLTRLEEEGYGFADPSTIYAKPDNEDRSN